MSKKLKVFFLFFLFVSLLLHGWLWWGIDYVAYYFPYTRISEIKQNNENRVEVELLEKAASEEIKKTQIVKQTDIPEELKLKELKEKADLLSEKLQRVLRESQAYLSGKTQNRISSERTQKATAKKTNTRKLDFTDATDAGFTNTPLFLSQAIPTPSQIGNILDRDIPLGEITALNTDQYIYYSFYSRIDDLVYERWQSKVHGLQHLLPLEILKSTPRRGWLTKAEFLISPEGHLIKAIVLKPSGIEELDWAALSAFKEAKIFPNPPQGMIQEDGLVHIHMGFTVRYNPTMVGGRR